MSGFRLQLHTLKGECDRGIIYHRDGNLVPCLESLIKKIPLTFQRNPNGLSLGYHADEFREGCGSTGSGRSLLFLCTVIRALLLFTRLILRCA